MSEKPILIYKGYAYDFELTFYFPIIPPF